MPRMHLLERESHLSSLMEYAAEAKCGDGRLVLIAGEAGVGKSSVLDQLEHDLVDSRWYSGACDGLFTPRPLAPLLDIAGQLGGELGSLCDKQAPRDQLFSALLRELTSRDGLTVVAIEDLHWADEATLDLLRFVGRRVRDARALVLVTYRDDGLAADDPLRIALGELSTQRTTRRLSLPPLSAGAVAELAVGTRVEADHLYRLTGGNPFYVAEALQTPTGDMPTSVRDAVLARAAGLTSAARHVLEVASLIGGRVSPEFLAHVSGATPSTIDDIISTGVLVGDGDRLRFRHEIARVAVQSAMAPHRTATAHRAILSELVATGSDDDARLAFHAEGAGDDALVLVHAPAAALRAAELAAHREAAAQYERAVRSAAAANNRLVASLYDSLSQELALVDRWEDSASARKEALRRWRELGDRLREGDSLRKLSRTMWRLCRGDEAEQAALAALAALEPLGPSTELAWAYAGLAGQRMNVGDFAESVRLAQQAQELASSLGLNEVLSDALNTEGCSNGSMGGDWEAPLRRSLEIAKGCGLAEEAGRAYANLYSFYSQLLRLAEGEGTFVEGVRYCDENDISTFANCLRGEHASVLERLGRWDEAEGLITGLIEKVIPSPVNRLNPLISLAKIRARRGDGEVWGPLDECIALADSLAQPEWVVHVRLARAEAHWLEGHDDDALAELSLATKAAADCCSVCVSSVAGWLHRVTRLPQPSADLSGPFAVEVSEDPQTAAAAWAASGLEYDAALALLGSDHEPLLRDALTRLEKLGASAAARLVRLRMRDLGIRAVPAGVRATTKAHPAGLTRREQQVLELLCAGLTNDEISAQLVVSVKTVDHHVSAVLAKLGVPSRKVAAAEAARRGLVGATT